jgi:putative hydrolase
MRSDPFRGRYVFHFHTRETDGRSDIEDYVDCALRHGAQRLILLEHIRRRPSYDVAAYHQRAIAAAAGRGLEICLGFEAKLLPDGTLDIAPEHAVLADVLGLAEHGFPDDLELLAKAFRTAAESYRAAFPDKEIVWVHPGLWLKKRRRLDEHWALYLELMAAAQSLGLRIERNRRHRLIPDRLVAAVTPGCLVHGLDAHSVEEMTAALAGRPDALAAWS